MTDEKSLSQALRTDWKRAIYRPFTSAVRDYELIAPGDAVAVCVSGGKDSMLLALCMREYLRHSPVKFALHFLMMDPGFSPENRENILARARQLEIPLTVFDTEVFAVADLAQDSPCRVCAKMRRGYLYRKARELGCNKIALGHHMDDVIETTLMSMLYEGRIQTMPPKRHSDRVEGMELIRPLYRVREKDIEAWRDANALTFSDCACAVARKSVDSMRRRTKEWIYAFEAENSVAARNLFRSVHNVSLDSMVGWKHKGETHSFLEDYR